MSFNINQFSGAEVERPRSVILAHTWDFDVINTQQATREPLVFIQDFSVPSISFDTEEYETGHTTYKFAKSAKWNDIKITFYDTAGLHNEIKKLLDKVWTPSEGLKTASSYKGDSKITARDEFGERQYEWTMKNSWVKAAEWDTASYTNSDVHFVSLTLAYDWAELN